MNQRVILTFVVAAVILLGGGAFFLVRNSSPDRPSPASQTQSTMNDSMAKPGSKSAAPTSTNSVAIQGFAFSPANITVKKGTTVTWTNRDSAAHTVTVDTDTSPASGASAGPDSGSVPFGKTYGYTFSGTGTFKYHCTFHPNMTGTVTVTE